MRTFGIEIKRITVVNQQNSKCYELGMNLNGSKVNKICVDNIHFIDPYPHYCGFDVAGNLLFSLEPSMPCDVEYLI